MIDADDKPSLLLVDDDADFRMVLCAALEKRGYAITTACTVEDALRFAEQNPPEFAVVDLKMPGASGLVLVRRLKELDEATRIVMLTGYASIATAIEAVKLGATHYLAKPANANEIISAFAKTAGDAQVCVAATPLSVDRLEWEHLQRVLQEHEGNISATARALNMHRRSLQRKLSKIPKK